MSSDAARSNYFRVTDEAAFRADMATLPDITVDTKHVDETLVCLLVTGEDGWPTSRTAADDNDEDVYVPALVATHLAEGHVAVFVYVGADRLRTLHASATAINAAGDTRQLALNDIYSLAEPLGEHITRAEY